MKLYFIRHGDKKSTSIINDKIHHTDPALTGLGIKQAETLIEYFKNENVDYIYASEYLRVKQTAEPLARARGVTVGYKLPEIVGIKFPVSCP